MRGALIKSFVRMHSLCVAVPPVRTTTGPSQRFALIKSLPTMVQPCYHFSISWCFWYQCVGPLFDLSIISGKPLKIDLLFWECFLLVDSVSSEALNWHGVRIKLPQALLYTLFCFILYQY